MKYKFYSIRINVTKYDVTFSTKVFLTPSKGVGRIISEERGGSGKKTEK